MCGYFCIAFIDFMLAGKILTDYTNLFSHHDFKKKWQYNSEFDKTKLSDQTKFRLYERKSYGKKLSKYVTAFDYIDKISIVLSATTGGVSIFSFTSVIGAPVGIATASFTLVFSLTTGIIKKFQNTTRKEKKKHDQIFMLAKSKFNSIETLISQALIDMDISHEEFIAIFKEKDRYEKMKENIRDKNENEKQENHKV